MSLWESIILGVVQGATEFLPVSSSGHLVVAQTLMGLRIPGIGFEIAVHLGTLISIALVYRERLRSMVFGAFRRERSAWSYLMLLVVATLPAGFVGVVFGDWIESRFDAPEVSGVGFLLTAVILLSTRIPMSRAPLTGVPGMRMAVVIGFAQALALLPGVSRSGTTVAAALWMGVAPVEAAAFSFLMALVAIAGAAVLKAPDLLADGSTLSPTLLIVGALVAAGVGVLAIQTLVALLRRQDFHRFAWYLIPLGLGFLAYLHFVPAS